MVQGAAVVPTYAPEDLLTLCVGRHCVVHTCADEICVSRLHVGGVLARRSSTLWGPVARLKRGKS